MPIPVLSENGLLPVGIFECTLAEIKERFGSFQQSDRRPELFARLEAFFSEAKVSGLVRSVIVNGSFVSGKAEPNDIDMIVELDVNHDFAADLSPAEYNVVSKIRVSRRYDFDLLVARSGSSEYHR